MDFLLPLRRIVTPDEIPAICSFLANEDSSLPIGAVLVAEGGTFFIDAKWVAMSTVFPDGYKG
jgi:hypothetical protein